MKERLLCDCNRWPSASFQLPLFLKEFVWPIRASAWRELWDQGSPWHFKLAKYPSYEANISICCSICSIRIISERWRRSSKIVELPFRLDVFAVRSRTSVWRRRSFGRNTFHDISNMQHTEALGPIFRYVAQYNIYHIWRKASHEQRLLNNLWEELFCCSFRTSSSTKTEFWRKTVHANSNIENTQATRPIFRYVAQYVRYWILSNGQRRSSKGCWITTLWSSCGCKCRDCFDRTTAWRELWDRGPPRHFEHWKYPSYEANISICCSICYILKHIWRTASLA